MDFMDHDERVQRVLELVAEVKAYPARYPALPVFERVVVAVALDRVDWLKIDGIDSVVQARDLVGLAWSQAISAARWMR